jgi:hypothetical protein
MMGKLFRLARSPQGRRLIKVAAKAASDPKNRERLAQVRSRLAKPKSG